MHTVESFYVLSEKHVNIQQVFWMTFSQHGNKDTNHKTLLVLDKGEGGREGGTGHCLAQKREAGQDKGGEISSLISPASFGWVTDCSGAWF